MLLASIQLVERFAAAVTDDVAAAAEYVAVATGSFVRDLAVNPPTHAVVYQHLD